MVPEGESKRRSSTNRLKIFQPFNARVETCIESGPKIRPDLSPDPERHLQVSVADPLVAFQCRAAGEVAGPEIVSAVSVREEVIRLQSPGSEKKTMSQQHKTHRKGICTRLWHAPPALLMSTLPGEVCSVQLLEVAGGRGVEHVDLAAVRLLRIDVVDQLVQVLVPQVGVLVLEV